MKRKTKVKIIDFVKRLLNYVECMPPYYIEQDEVKIQTLKNEDVYDITMDKNAFEKMIAHKIGVWLHKHSIIVIEYERRNERSFYVYSTLNYVKLKK